MQKLHSRRARHCGLACALHLVLKHPHCPCEDIVPAVHALRRAMHGPQPHKASLHCSAYVVNAVCSLVKLVRLLHGISPACHTSSMSETSTRLPQACWAAPCTREQSSPPPAGMALGAAARH